MALRYSIATGNFTSAATWGLVDATSHSNSESANVALTTSYTASNGSTIGVIIILGIALKLAQRLGTTGTMSAHLAVAGVEVPGTLVTINVADLPVGTTADLNGGWHFFKFASPVTSMGATSYTVEAKTSSATQVSLYSTAATNWSRCLVTTTTGAPAAGDDVIYGGAYTGQGTSDSIVVTYDETATTDYGAASTSLVTPAIAWCNKCILLVGTAAATAYKLKVSGHAIVYSGSTFSIAAVGTNMPSDSSFEMIFDCAVNVDFGLTIRNLSTSIGQGNPFTTQFCLLNTDEAVNSTSLGVDRVTNWPDNAEIAIASTTRTNTQAEQGTMNGAAGASTLTVDGFAGAGGGLAAAHSGTSPTQAAVILLTRNILIRGASATLQAFIDIKATAIVDWDWVEVKWMGSATANKRGVDIACTTGIQTFHYCSFHNFEVASSLGFNHSGATGTGLTFLNNVTFKIANGHFINVANTGSSIVDGNIFMLNITGGVSGVTIGDIGGTFTNNVSCCMTSVGIATTETGSPFGTWSGNIVHSNANAGLAITNMPSGGIVSNTNTWRNGAAGLTVQAGDYTIDGITAFGNTTSNITNTGGSFRVVLINPILNGDTTFATTNGILMAASVGGGEFIVYNGNFGTASGIKTAHTNDISWGSATIQPYGKIYLFNPILASSVEVLGQSNMSPNSIITIQRNDQTAGLHKTIRKYGTLAIETTTTQAGGHSLKMTPINASFKLESTGDRGSFKVLVANGQTCTPSIYVYEDAGYNGARSRLILKRNDAMGISADVVLDTATAASDAAWEQLTGTTAAVTDNGVLEFVVDCDGTTGNLFVDSFSATVT